MKIRIAAGDVTAEAELDGSRTASAVAEALPLEGRASTWGEEIYFEIPLALEAENATTEVDVGDLGYWVQGRCFCVFFGRTPASTADRPVPASPVNVFGRLTTPPEALKDVRPGEQVRVEAG